MATGDLTDIMTQLAALIIPQPPTIPSQNVQRWFPANLNAGVPRVVFSLAKPTVSGFVAIGGATMNEQHWIRITFFDIAGRPGGPADVPGVQDELLGWLETCRTNIKANPRLIDGGGVQHAVIVGTHLARASGNPPKMEWHVDAPLDQSTGQPLPAGWIVVPVEGKWNVG